MHIKCFLQFQRADSSKCSSLRPVYGSPDHQQQREALHLQQRTQNLPEEFFHGGPGGENYIARSSFPKRKLETIFQHKISITLFHLR